jgi:hypothetical protein
LRHRYLSLRLLPIGERHKGVSRTTTLLTVS